MRRIGELYKGNKGEEKSDRVRAQGGNITRALYKLYPLELTTEEELKPNETAEDLRENNLSVVESSEDKNHPHLNSDGRLRRKNLTEALKRLKDYLDDDDDFNEKE